MLLHLLRSRVDDIPCGLRSLTLLWLMLLASLSVMAQGFCTFLPGPGTITNPIVNPCASDSAAGNNLESRAVQAWLDIHQLLQSDSSILYQYGRADVRNQIRAMMLNETLRIIAKDPSTRDDYEKSVYDWIHGQVRAKELQLYQRAVDDANQWSYNPCAWRPDPDVAAVYGLKYDSAMWCSGNPLVTSFLFGPPIPAKSYFLGAALKYAYGQPVANSSGGKSLSALQLMSYEMYGYGALAGAALATPAGILIYNNAASLVSYINEAALANLGADIAAATNVGSAVTDVAGATAGASAASAADASASAALAAGPVAIILIAVELGVQAAFQFYSYIQQQQDLSDLRNILTHVQNNDQNLQDWLGDPQGRYKLATTLLANTLPDAPSTQPLPRPRKGVDPFFNVSLATGNTVEMDMLIYPDKMGTTWQIQAYGGWFVQRSVSKSGVVTDTISPTLTITDNNNVVWLVDRVGPNFLISKVQPASGDVECPADASTGVTPQSALTAHHCYRYVASSFFLPDFTPVTLGQTPGFTNDAIAAFSAKSSFTTDITTVGIPAPALSAAGLPPGVTFTIVSPGRGRLSGTDGVAPGSYPIQLTARNGTGTATQSFQLIVGTAVQIVSPDHFSVQGGIPTTFRIRTTGVPAPRITFQNVPCSHPNLVPDPCLFAPTAQPGFQIPAGMTFTDQGDGTATLSGVYGGSLLQDQSNGGNLTGIVTASNGVNTTSQTLTIHTSLATDATLVGALNASFTPDDISSAAINTKGTRAPVSFKLQGFPPSNARWMTFHDNGNGSATVSGRPPRTDSSYDATFSLCPDTLGGQHVCFYTPYTVHVSATPIFTDPPSRKVTKCRVRENCILMATTNMLSGAFSLDDQTPSGLALRQNPGRGQLSWMPTSGGAYPVSVTATNGAGSATAVYTFYVQEAPDFPTIGSGDIWLMIGQPASITIPTTGYPHDVGVTIANMQILPPMTLSLHGQSLPAGVSFSSANARGVPTGTAIISGIPARGAEGNYRMSLEANNGLSHRADITLHVRIAGDADGDGNANCQDYNFIKTALGQVRGQASYDARADLNNDGVVDATDLGVLSQFPATASCR